MTHRASLLCCSVAATLKAPNHTTKKLTKRNKTSPTRRIRIVDLPPVVVSPSSREEAQKKLAPRAVRFAHLAIRVPQYTSRINQTAHPLFKHNPIGTRLQRAELEDPLACVNGIVAVTEAAFIVVMDQRQGIRIIRGDVDFTTGTVFP